MICPKNIWGMQKRKEKLEYNFSLLLNFYVLDNQETAVQANASMEKLYLMLDKQCFRFETAVLLGEKFKFKS